MTPHERDYQNGSTFTLHTHTIYIQTHTTPFFSAAVSLRYENDEWNEWR